MTTRRRGSYVSKYLVASRLATPVSFPPRSVRNRRTRLGSRFDNSRSHQPIAFWMNHCAIVRQPRSPAEHPFGVAFLLRPGQGENQRRAPCPQMRAFDPGLDGVEPAGLLDEAARRDGRQIVRNRPAVEIDEPPGHEAPDLAVGHDRFPRENPPRDDFEVPHRLAPQAPAELERLSCERSPSVSLIATSMFGSATPQCSQRDFW